MYREKDSNVFVYIRLALASAFIAVSFPFSPGDESSQYLTCLFDSDVMSKALKCHESYYYHLSIFLLGVAPAVDEIHKNYQKSSRLRESPF